MGRARGDGKVKGREGELADMMGIIRKEKKREEKDSLVMGSDGKDT